MVLHTGDIQAACKGHPIIGHQTRPQNIWSTIERPRHQLSLQKNTLSSSMLSNVIRVAYAGYWINFIGFYEFLSAREVSFLF